MTFLRLIFILAAAFLAVLPGRSQAGSAAAIDVPIDQAHIVRLDAEAAQVIVGNPAIADVSVRDARMLVVTGKSYGETNLIALDHSGAEILSTLIAVRDGSLRTVTLYNGGERRTYFCDPGCLRMLAIGDDKAQFDELAQSVERKFGVVNSAIGGN